MAVAIRLTRIGKHKQPFYRIVATDSRQARDAKYIELVGTYDVLKGKAEVKEEVALKWLNLGAKPTESVREIFSDKGIMKKFHESKGKK